MSSDRGTKSILVLAGGGLLVVLLGGVLVGGIGLRGAQRDETGSALPSTTARSAVSTSTTAGTTATTSPATVATRAPYDGVVGCFRARLPLFDFRVGNRGFVWSYPERRPGRPRVIRTDVAVLYVGDEAEKQALVLGEPDKFFTTSGYDGWPLVMLRLDEVSVERLEELITDAWRMRTDREG